MAFESERMFAHVWDRCTFREWTDVRPDGSGSLPSEGRVRWWPPERLVLYYSLKMLVFLNGSNMGQVDEDKEKTQKLMGKI